MQKGERMAGRAGFNETQKIDTDRYKERQRGTGAKY